MIYFAITGRLAEISIAELEAVFGAEHIKALSSEVVQIEGDLSPKDCARLGGTIKVARFLSELPDSWQEIEEYLVRTTPEHAQYAEGKLHIGISLYGIKLPVHRLHKTLLGIKKSVRASGKSVRVLLNKDTVLSSAEVFHNNLTGKNGWELIVIKAGSKTVLAQSIFVQDIDSYTLRDRGRPKRDSRVGMLPPKLAQIIINLGVGNAIVDKHTLLDPFCGTGVVLQEALLMGMNVYGTDMEERMVSYTAANLDWLRARYPTTKNSILSVGDARKFTWSPTPTVVAGETYLGPPLTSYVSDAELAKLTGPVNKLHEDFLIHIGKQLAPGTRLCLAIPAWRRKMGYKHLPVLEKLPSLGYNWVELEHSDSRKLMYDRPDQFVARQLITITKA